MAKTYAQAGVDINKIRKMQAGINSALSMTKNEYTPDFIAGHYAGFFEVGGNKLSVHTDGVGSKILVAQELGIHDTVGIDAVAMNVNDIICVGSRPIVGVDYLALSRTDEQLVNEIMKGLVSGCKEAHVALVGGETAILPDMIKSDKKRKNADYDLAFTAIGINEGEIITGAKMEEGDALVGLASSGLHSNGFSLARKLLPAKDWGEQMLTPTRIYVDAIMEIIEKAKVGGIAHITGGAFSKLSRIGEHAKVGFVLDEMPKSDGIFAEVEKKVGDLRECYRTFNMGVGMAVACPQEEVHKIISISKMHKIEAGRIGKIVKGNDVVLQKDGKKLSLL
ncbi:MAG: phosphoribosylformylglycinamidine cyclo-ligase [Candidatus Micrarchaeota archaeon]